MKKSIFFLAASAIMFAMGSCTNDVLDNVQQVDSSLPQTRATASNDWTYAYVLSEGTWHVAPPSSPGNIVRYDNNWTKKSTLEIGDTGNDLIQYGSKLYCAVSGHDLTAPVNFPHPKGNNTMMKKPGTKLCQDTWLLPMEKYISAFIQGQ